jgi:hypothetical protein
MQMCAGQNVCNSPNYKTSTNTIMDYQYKQLKKAMKMMNYCYSQTWMKLTILY